MFLWGQNLAIFMLVDLRKHENFENDIVISKKHKIKLFKNNYFCVIFF